MKKGSAATGRAPNQVRIIGGQWKRTPLPVPDAPGLRPTPDRVRETAFNWLNHLYEGDWEGRLCLDLFAGSGALGFEAASRGAASVTMVESNAAAVRQLKATREKLDAQQVHILHADAWAALQDAARAAGVSAAASPAVLRIADAHTQGYDLVFLDPPYHQGWLGRMLPVCASILREGGLVYAESECSLAEQALEWMCNWEVIRADKAGMVFYHLLKSIKTA